MIATVIELHIFATPVQFLFMAIGWGLAIFAPILDKQYNSILKIWVENHGYFYTENFLYYNLSALAIILLLNTYTYVYLKWLDILKEEKDKTENIED